MRGGDFGRGRFGMLLGAVGLVAVGYPVYLLTSGEQDAGDKISSIIGVSIGLCSLVVATASLHLQRRSVPPLETICERLARRVAAQWRDELVVRGLDDPLVTSWSVIAQPGPAATWVLGFTGQGDITEAESWWRALDSPRLAVLGEPGSGKTSLVVTLVEALARTHQVGEPVPILVTLSAWRAGCFQDWLVGEISRRYRVPAEVVRDLFARGWLLPVLDGLDEVLITRRPEALRAVAQWAGNIRPFVLTCRTAEFEEVVKASGERLGFASTVEMLPISPAEVAAYLTADGAFRSRWGAVIDYIEASSESPLADALSTPLMAYLARTAYRDPSSDPSHLLVLDSTEEIEEHLLERYIPAVYDPRPWATTAQRYTTKQARRWLTTIALATELEGFGRGYPLVRARLAIVTIVALFALSVWGAQAMMHDSTAVTVGCLAGLTAVVFLIGGLMGRISWGMAVVGYLSISLVSLLASFILLALSSWEGIPRVLLFVVAFPLLVFGLVVVLGVVDRLWAAVCGALPLRIGLFLRDAHVRGVLRESGDGFRLRHEQLRRNLERAAVKAS